MAVRWRSVLRSRTFTPEGYPEEATRWMSEEEILDYPARLGDYRRNGDPLLTKAWNMRTWSDHWLPPHGGSLCRERIHC